MARTLNVTLPEALEAYVNERVAEVGYGSPGDHIRTLIREDQERRTPARTSIACPSKGSIPSLISSPRNS